MTKLNDNAHVYADQTYAVWTAPAGTALPVTLPPTAPAGFYEVGLLSDAGITEAHNYNENKIYDLSGSLVRIARNQEERPFTFEALEYNAITCGLLYPNSSLTTTSTAEVQTITISGSPTGGTFTLTLPGVGTASALAYNISLANLAAALSSAFGMTIPTPTGTPGTSYVVTFPAAEGNVSQMTASGAGLTGGTSPAVAVATTTPGVAGVNTRGVGAGTGRNLRPFVLDLVDGAFHKRITINNGEAVQSGTVTYSSSGAAIYQFTLQPYKDAFGFYYTVMDDSPALGEAFA